MESTTSGKAPLIGVVLAGRYAIERQLGEGATSIVYLARDARDGSQVAIKTLRPELAQSISAQRFVREISLTSRLQNDAIVPVLDSGGHDGILFCVLTYMKGGTLRDRLQTERQLPMSEAIALSATLADALDYAHRNNLMHRDVKPENILFDGDRVALADFGIAKAIERAAGESTTVTGIVRGTPAYMSPEQAGGDSAYDGRSDIFSLGCVVYEMIAGVQAFIGPTPQSVVAQRLLHPPRPLSVYRPATPPALNAVIAKALATLPADRYQRASDFATALRTASTTLDPERTRLRYLWPVAAGIIATVAVVAAIVVLTRPQRGNTLAAREQLVRGDLYAERSRTPEMMLQAVAAYDSATKLDPTLAVAYGRLAQAHSYTYADFDRSSAREAQAKEALDHALRLAPALPATRLALGFYQYWVRGQPDSAIVVLNAARSLEPDNAELLAGTATILRAAARWSEALALTRRALELEPQRWISEVAAIELWMNRYADADRDLQRVLQLRPDNVAGYLQRAWLQMLWNGDTAEVHRVLAEGEKHLSRLQIVRGFLVKYRSGFAMLGPQWQDELERRSAEELGVPSGSYHLAKMELYQRRADLRRARAHADSAVAQFEPRAQANPSDEYLRGELAAGYAGQGRVTDARREAAVAMEFADRRNDATLRAFRSADVIRVYLSMGDYDNAVTQLSKERRDATILSQRALLKHPDFSPLRNRADFRALLATFP